MNFPLLPDDVSVLVGDVVTAQVSGDVKAVNEVGGYIVIVNGFNGERMHIPNYNVLSVSTPTNDEIGTIRMIEHGSRKYIKVADDTWVLYGSKSHVDSDSVAAFTDKEMRICTVIES